MRIRLAPCFALLVAWALLAGGAGRLRAKEKLIPHDARNLSLRNEVQHAVDQGLEWLQTKQNPSGFWGRQDEPAVTALALRGFLGDPGEGYRDGILVKKGFAYLESCERRDGGIYKEKESASYTTSVSIMAFLALGDPKYDDLLRRAKAFLLARQSVSGSNFDMSSVGMLKGPDDRSLKSVFKWLQKHYFVSPETRNKGYYRNIRIAAEVLSASGMNQVERPDGTRWDWNPDLAKRLINLQNTDGSFVEDDDRAGAQNPVLTTCYGVLTLEILYLAM